jgi:hypothetical protein
MIFIEIVSNKKSVYHLMNKRLSFYDNHPMNFPGSLNLWPFKYGPRPCSVPFKVQFLAVIHPLLGAAKNE